MSNKTSNKRTFHGTDIPYFSMKFLTVIFLATLLSLTTVLVAVVFSVISAVGRMVKTPSGTKRVDDGEFELVCLSHVPWDGLWQRNQQTMSRLSVTEKVIYARPVHTIEASLNRRHLSCFFGKRGDGNLLVINPVIFWGDTRLRSIQRLNRWIILSNLKFGMMRAGFKDLPLVLWLYFPRWWYIYGGLGEDLLVYDIQDDYVTWTTATRDTATREQNLLERSHLVFTGTNSLSRNKRRWNQNIHFVQNGVESDHFSRALREDTVIPEDIRDLPHPIIGYFGLIGDRVDVSIIEILADRHPEWSILLIGPVRDEMCDVPVRDNIYLTGQRDYDTLPGYLKGFDVAIIPYLLNDTTMDLNPTKLLEYLAGGKPVVSTAMTDVAELFSDYVGVAHDPLEFLALTEEAVEKPDESLIERGIEFANGFTWEEMARRMREMILEMLKGGEVRS
jgi:glycosyltransferase involved in cell wall biosynthesis